MSDQLIRCFIAINLPDNILAPIQTYISDLKRLASGVRWVKVENIHITLKFLGEITSEKVDTIAKQLVAVENIVKAFDLYVGGSGCFPSRKNPRVFWLGLEQGSENPLFMLYQHIENQLIPLGFAREKRRFSPHLTLGRVKNREDFSKLYSFLDQYPFQKLTFRVDTLYFMQSQLKPSGAQYSVIQEYVFR